MGWTARFKSFNGTDCRIEIDGGGTEVTAAATPITIEENDSDDLLDVVRFKTGYINLLESYYGELDEIYPETNTSRTVRVYYGTDIVFVGFLQAQSFENKWDSYREISFPIISPLGLLDDIKMPVYNPPRAVTLAELLADVVDALRGLGAQYNRVIWPQMSVPLSETVSSLVFCPFNPDHDATYVSPPLFESRSCLDFIDGLCNAFGWMVHETALELVFTKFDHEGKYNQCNASDIRTLASVNEDSHDGEDSFRLEDDFEYHDNDASISTVMPVEEVELEYEGDYVKSALLNFSHMSYRSNVRDGNQVAAWLTSSTPELTGDAILVNNYFYQGKLTMEGVNVCSFGNPSQQEEGILINLPNSTIHTTELFTVRFYERPTGNGFQIKFNLKWADTILNLGNEEISHKRIGVVIKIGDLYYHGQGQWKAEAANPYTYGGSEFYWVDGITNAPEGFPIEVSFHEVSATGTDPVQLLAVTGIRLEELPTLFSDYMVTKRDTDTIRLADGSGQGTASVSLAMSCYRKNSNTIGTTTVARFTNYTYLLKSQQRMTARFIRTGSLPSWIYQMYANFDNKNWRVISVSQNLRDDEYTITMHRMITNE